MAKRKLYTGQPGTGAAAVYTAPAGTYVTIFAATVCDPTAGPDDLEVWLVPSGASQTDANKVYDAKTISANSEEGLALLINQTLEPGDAIYMAAATAATLTVHISGDLTTA